VHNRIQIASLPLSMFIRDYKLMSPLPAVVHRYEIAHHFIAQKWESAEQTGTRYTRMQVPYEGDRKLVSCMRLMARTHSALRSATLRGDRRAAAASGVARSAATSAVSGA
jgi:hypothetical protein